VRTLVLLVILLSPVSVFAQGIQPNPTAPISGNCPPGSNNGTVRSGLPFRIYWCQPASDSLVGAKIAGLPAGTFQLDNVRIERGPFLGDTLTQWSAAIPPQPRGNYTIILTVQNYGLPGDLNTLQESPGSLPFGLGVVDSQPMPAAPKNLRIDAGNPTATTAAPRNRAPQ